ncbi:DUF1624 domain-containing protein [Ornithinimicrobium sp. Arc0846-15]|nr:DUF1624 domain-containing protein [Ornithinimicrobium laminariae]
MSVPLSSAAEIADPKPTRIVGVDVARTLALIGMFTAHIGSRYDASGEVALTFQVVAGRSSALFAVLAGVSLVLMSERQLREVPPAVSAVRISIAMRAMLVAMIGLFFGALDSGVAVILVNYGLLFLFAIPVITWGWRKLMALAAFWLVASPTLTWLLTPYLPTPSGRVTSLFSLVTPMESTSELLFTGYYPVITWGTYLFFGMALARLDLRRPVVAAALLVGGSVVACLTLATSWAYTGSAAIKGALTADVGLPWSQWPDLADRLKLGWAGDPALTSWLWMPVWAPHTGTMMDLLHTCATAAAALGLGLVATAAIPAPWARSWQIFWGAGAVSLTLYVTHVVLLAGPAIGGRALLAHTVGALLIGMVFAATRHRGPLEALVSAALRQPSATTRL